MAKITITITDIPGGDMLSIAIQSENPEQAETAAMQCAGEVLSFLCARVQGLEEQMLKSDTKVAH
jgi:hypothetical protein